MNNYTNVIQIAKDLQEEFPKKITIVEALQIAAQINIADCLSDGLQTGSAHEPAFLEAIAMAIGFKPKNERIGTSTVSEALMEISSSIQNLSDKDY